MDRIRDGEESVTGWGVLVLAAVAKQRGYEVAIVDAKGGGITLEEATARVAALAPDVLGISATTISINNGARIAAAVKDAAAARHDGRRRTARERGARGDARRVPRVRLRHLGRGRGRVLRAPRRARERHLAARSARRRRPRRERRGARQLPRALPRRSRQPAVSGLGRARRRLPAPLRPVDLQLSLHAGRDARHLARLPVLLHVLRPLDLGQARPLPQRRVRDGDVPHAGGPRHPPRALLRRPLHREEEARDRALRGDGPRQAALHLELQQPSQSARPRHHEAHEARRLLADRVRRRVGVATGAERREARGEAAAPARDAAHDARRRHPRQGLPDARPSDRGSGEPRRDARVPGGRRPRRRAGHQVHPLSRDAGVSDHPAVRRLHRGLGADERDELHLHPERPHRGDPRGVLRSLLPRLLQPAARALGPGARVRGAAELHPALPQLRPRLFRGRPGAPERTPERPSARRDPIGRPTPVPPPSVGSLSRPDIQAPAAP